MRKWISLMAFTLLPAVVFAQYEITETPVEKHSVSTNKFFSNWFFTVGGDYMAHYSDQEYGRGLSANPFEQFRRTWGGDIALGKWFTPGVGLRMKAYGLKGKQIEGDPGEDIDRWDLSFQALFNLRNLFAGYEPGRIWNISLYGGSGFTRNCSYNRYGMITNIGLLNTFKISRRLYINWDIYGQLNHGHSDGVTIDRQPGMKRFRTLDRNVGMSLGIGLNLGKVEWKRAVDMDAVSTLNEGELMALQATLADYEAENARLKKALAEKEKEAEPRMVCTESVKAVLSVFFKVNTTELISEKDWVNVRTFVEMVRRSTQKIRVTGYADSATGSEEFNRKLSEKRARKVADELVSMGIDAERLVVEGRGGVTDLSPDSYNRRVIVTLE